MTITKRVFPPTKLVLDIVPSGGYRILVGDKVLVTGTDVALARDIVISHNADVAKAHLQGTALL